MGWPWPVALLGYLTSSATATLVLSAASSVLAAACWAAYTALSLLVRRLDEDAAVARTHLLEDPYSAKRIPAPSIHSEPSKSLTVVFPAFNEGARMEPAIEEALEHLAVQRKATPGFSYEVILVDDGSKDDTYQQAMKFVERLGLDTFRVIHFPVNRGKGAAVRAGALAARGELVLFADADGATQFSDLERLRARMGEIASEAGASESRGLFSGIADRQGVVAGSRAHLETTDAVTQREWYRQVLMHGFHFLVTLVAGKRIRDTQCGFKVRCPATAWQTCCLLQGACRRRLTPAAARAALHAQERAPPLLKPAPTALVLRCGAGLPRAAPAHPARGGERDVGRGGGHQDPVVGAAEHGARFAARQGGVRLRRMGGARRRGSAVAGRGGAQRVAAAG